mmetsp:Transcript_25728/g.43734  ORF Transcript_25728/g.43734 Transcript_25728/m.43734 type:complete len:81 (-) Transcript_25728:344-586(-)
MAAIAVVGSFARTSQKPTMSMSAVRAASVGVWRQRISISVAYVNKERILSQDLSVGFQARLVVTDLISCQNFQGGPGLAE